jgi:cytochrome c553
MRHRLLIPVTLLLLIALPATAAETPAVQDSGKDINGPCAACHGELGQGGKRGEYPRLAGQKPAFLEQQLRNFRSRTRLNIPMLPYTQERELSDEDIRQVAAYLAGITLQTEFPDFKETDDALTRLEAMEKVMIIPKLAGDLANGKALYDDECAYCHGGTGRGIRRFPMLVGQYTNYLQRQIDAYLKRERPHDSDESLGVLGRLSKKDIDDILAHITYLQDVKP